MSPESFTDKLVWLLELSHSMVVTRDLSRLLPMIADACVDLTAADRAVIFLFNHDTSKIVQRLARSKAHETIHTPDNRIYTLASEVYRERKPIFATESTADALASTRRQFSELRLIKMLVCLPLICENEALGVIYADGRSEVAETEETRKMAQIFADHAALALENAGLFQRATNDPLTGLPNSSQFLVQLNKVMRQATASAPAGILLLDLDSFKRVNQAAGAEMGDRALMDIASTLQEVLRADGLVARYGSDKFGVLLPPEEGTSIRVRLYDAAERARAAIGTKAYHGVQITASIGGISYPQEGIESAGDIVALADDVLGRARARGPGQVEIG